MTTINGDQRVFGSVGITGGSIDIRNILGTVDVTNIENIGTLDTLNSVKSGSIGILEGTVSIRTIQSGSIGILGQPIQITGTLSSLGTIDTINTLKSGSVGILGGTVSIGDVGTVREVSSVKSGSISILGRLFGSATESNAVHIGAGSTITGTFRDVSQFKTKTVGFLLEGDTGQASLIGRFSDETGTVIFNDEIDNGKLKIFTFEDALKEVQARTKSDSLEGTLSVFFGEQA